MLGNEAQSRILINQLLTNAGWRFNNGRDKELYFPANVIPEWDIKSPDGEKMYRADYALFDPHNYPICIVEANTPDNFSDSSQHYLHSSTIAANIQSFCKYTSNSNYSFKTKIPLPPLEEQEKIIAEIEGYQKVIDGCNMVIDNYKPTFKIDPSWEKVRLGEVCEIVRDSWLPDMTDTNLTNYIGLENISANTGYLIGNILVTKNSIKSNKTIFRQDDILFGRLRPNLNKVLLADCEGICSTDILVLRVNKNLVEPYFLSTVMRQRSFNLELLKFVKGAQLPRISAEDLFSVAVLIPKLQVQKSLVEELKKDLQVLAEINSICIKYQKKINELFESFFL